MKRRSKSKPAKGPLRDASRGIRLHKALADLGVASRRASETLVQEGRVAVNGETITTLPAWVDPNSDRIEVDGRVVNNTSRGGHYYIMVNKPRAVICTNHDPEGRRSIIDLVPFDRRLFCVGRLDHDSTGLTLLTDDGDLAHRLTHPSYGIPKTYRVTLKGFLEDEAIERLRSGIWLGPRGKQRQAAKAQAAKVSILARDRDRTRACSSNCAKAEIEKFDACSLVSN